MKYMQMSTILRWEVGSDTNLRHTQLEVLWIWKPSHLLILISLLVLLRSRYVPSHPLFIRSYIPIYQYTNISIDGIHSITLYPFILICSCCLCYWWRYWYRLLSLNFVCFVLVYWHVGMLAYGRVLWQQASIEDTTAFIADPSACTVTPPDISVFNIALRLNITPKVRRSIDRLIHSYMQIICECCCCCCRMLLVIVNHWVLILSLLHKIYTGKIDWFHTIYCGTTIACATCLLCLFGWFRLVD